MEVKVLRQQGYSAFWEMSVMVQQLRIQSSIAALQRVHQKQVVQMGRQTNQMVVEGHLPLLVGVRAMGEEELVQWLQAVADQAKVAV